MTSAAWWLGALAPLAVFVACSDSTNANPGPPSQVQRYPDGGVILPDGAPNEPVVCPLVTKSAACAVPADLKGFSLGSAWATTNEQCKTKLYISKIIVGDVVDTYELKRYSLKTATPCVIEEDKDFKGGVPGDFLTADDDEKVYSVTPKGVVQRIAPLPVVDCETDLDPAKDELQPTAITMLREGTRGYVAFAKLVEGAAVERKIARLDPTEKGCTVTEIKLSQPISGSIDGLQIDTKGRIHAVDHAKENDRVAIYLPSGEFVTDYKTGAGGEPMKQLRGITACRGGLCVEDSGTAVAVDENGRFRAETVYTPSEATSAHIFVGTVRGPFFAVGAVNAGEKILVDLLAEHE
ncbi:MAG: hypothetical protein U0270_04100 [Labilithrix sp.]